MLLCNIILCDFLARLCQWIGCQGEGKGGHVSTEDQSSSGDPAGMEEIHS